MQHWTRLLCHHQSKKSMSHTYAHILTYGAISSTFTCICKYTHIPAPAVTHSCRSLSLSSFYSLEMKSKLIINANNELQKAARKHSARRGERSIGWLVLGRIPTDQLNPSLTGKYCRKDESSDDENDLRDTRISLLIEPAHLSLRSPCRYRRMRERGRRSKRM